MAHRRYWYEPSQPREVKGGIKAQSKTGGFGRNWWARRWIDVLESFDIDSRLSRGRNYARRGQVVSIEIAKGRVSALVQGSRPKPYKVIIGVKPIPAAGWRKATAAMAAKAAFSAKLLNGLMPDEIEKAFASATLSLFPESLSELETECSCPDWSNPCKHIAAVYYLLGEEFDRDPFLIFRLRGMEREELLEALGKAAVAKPRRKRSTGGAEQAVILPAAARLPEDPAEFWGRDEDFTFPEAGDPPPSPPLLARLVSFPFWRGTGTFQNEMEGIYREASPAGMDVFLGEPAGTRWAQSRSARMRTPRRLMKMPATRE
ncbi:MAG: SWIM zinc finger family protein [Spirochaetes bacterium]|nr:SWIM zinc finger family protein [Spirochaetota bacterium]